MASKLKEILLSERGATAIEYALVVGLIATVIITAVASLGSSVGGMYATIATSVK